MASVLTHWSAEPTVIAGLVLATVVFCALQRRPELAVDGGRRGCFGMAILLLAVALLSPLDELSDRYLLVAHMIQHLLMVLLIAPLLVRALPVPWGERLRIHPALAFGLF